MKLIGEQSLDALEAVRKRGQLVGCQYKAGVLHTVGVDCLSILTLSVGVSLNKFFFVFVSELTSVDK